jgi:hypothetical protein
VWLLISVLLSACSSGAGAATQRQHTASGASVGGSSADVDPQAFQDVVESVYMVPGPNQRRVIRLSNFTQDLIFASCGGVGPPLDNTADRFMQQLFPDLELIQERGLVEPESPVVHAGTKPGCDIVSSGVSKQLPSREDVMDLIQPWLDIVMTTTEDPALLALKRPMWECMTSRSSLDVGQDVPIDFLKAVNVALARDGAETTEMKTLSGIYADCGDAYFKRLRELLLPKRPAEFERNRELLQRYASELMALGYLP